MAHWRGEQVLRGKSVHRLKQKQTNLNTVSVWRKLREAVTVIIVGQMVAFFFLRGPTSSEGRRVGEGKEPAGGGDAVPGAGRRDHG